MIGRLLLAASVAVASLSAACGGGGSTPPPPPSAGGFTAASLKGNFAFSMSGEDINANIKQRVGSFIADGNGNITQAIEDVNTGGSLNQVTFTGTYTIRSNGRGQITLNSTVGGGLIFSFVMTAASPSGQGLLVETDPNLVETASGAFAQQDITSFSKPFQSANYVFDFSGESNGTAGLAPLSIVGEFSANTGGGIIGGLMDINDGNKTAPQPAVPISPNGAYQIDAANSATFGRGFATFGGLSFVFYTVDDTHAKFLETDSAGFTVGDALIQSASIPTTTAQWNTGNFAYLVAGAAAAPGRVVSLANASAFATDGKGNLGNIVSTDNNGGTVSQVTSGASGTYTIDSANAGTGRGTLSITVNGQSQPFTGVFYLISPTQAVFQDTSSGAIADGSLNAQAAVTGTNFAFNWSGQNLQAGFEEDFVGQYSTSSNSGQFNGAMDYTQLGSSGSQFIFLDIPITVTSSSFTGTGNSAFKAVSGNTPSATYLFQAYSTVNGVLLISTQSSRVTVGIVLAQP